MSFLPKDVQQALRDAHRTMQQKSHRLCVHTGDKIYPITQLRSESFSIRAETAPKLRGFVDIYDGARHLSQCLIVTSRQDDGERVYDFKWNTGVAEYPAVDYVRDEDAPAALLADY